MLKHWKVTIRNFTPINKTFCGLFKLCSSWCNGIEVIGRWACRMSWWRHQMEIFSAFLAIYAENSQVTGEFSTQRPVTRSFGVFFDARLNKRLSKQSWVWWFETLTRSLWRHCNVFTSSDITGVSRRPNDPNEDLRAGSRYQGQGQVITCIYLGYLLLSHMSSNGSVKGIYFAV